MFGSIEALESLLPFKFTSSSTPTRAQAEDLLSKHSSVLELVLRAKGVPVPKTATSAHSFLSRVVLLRTAADILRRRALEQGDPSAPLADSYERQAIELQGIVDANPQAFFEP